MPPNTKNVVTDVVLVNTDDDDDGGGGRGLSLTENPQIPTTVASLETLECRSFWKAGESFVTPNVATPAAPGMLEHARVHPKFLHSNATSHKWAFGAIAELLDNAVDEIQNGATFVKIDKIDIVKNNSPALVFRDDGAGMAPDGLRKCMSLGYSSKKSNTTIGQYGNGFKTSTMRLGADVIVFTRSTRSGKSTQSVGLLSYTFLRRTGQDDVIVPMIDLDISKERPQPIIYGSSEDWSSNLNILLKWSPFSTEDELFQQFEDIGTHGTKVIIYNLWLNDEGIYELTFDDDDEDIRLRDESVHDGKRVHHKELERRSHISYYFRFSLRIDKGMMDELKDVKKVLNPTETLLDVDAMTGQEAAALVTTFNVELGITGAILTKLDGDSRALSVKEVSGKAIKPVGRGERMEDLEPFYPNRMAGRILGMGDVVSLVEKAEEVLLGRGKGETRVSSRISRREEKELVKIQERQNKRAETNIVPPRASNLNHLFITG